MRECLAIAEFLRGGACASNRARKALILFASQLVQIAETDQADEGPHPSGNVEHQRIDAGPKKFMIRQVVPQAISTMTARGSM